MQPFDRLGRGCESERAAGALYLSRILHSRAGGSESRRGIRGVGLRSGSLLIRTQADSGVYGVLSRADERRGAVWIGDDFALAVRDMNDVVTLRVAFGFHQLDSL